MMASNIMFDRRVVRGNTYAARVSDGGLPGASDLSLGLCVTLPSYHPQILPVEPTTTMSTLKRSTRGSTGVKPQPLGAPEPVEGRRHIDIQTDAYLEELTDIVPEEDATTQTEAFIDRPPTPLFMPQKTGMDAETQIEPGDLFDFDFEVEPILEVLVGKVLEQGLMEVQEEEELAAMRAHQEHFEQIRNAELIATQRMEEAEKRKMQEKERRLAQERQRVERERTVRCELACHVAQVEFPRPGRRQPHSSAPTAPAGRRWRRARSRAATSTASWAPSSSTCATRACSSTPWSARCRAHSCPRCSTRRRRTSAGRRPPGTRCTPSSSRPSACCGTRSSVPSRRGWTRSAAARRRRGGRPR